MAEAIVLFGGALCGTTGTALVRLAPDAPPSSAGAARLLVGGISLAAIARATRQRPSSLRTHGRWLAAGAVAVALYQVCFFTGTTRTGIALATVVALGSAPVFSGLINAAILRQRPTTAWTAGTTLAIVGVVLIAGHQPASRTDVGGIVAALVAGLAWAVYAIIARQRITAGLDSTSCMAAMFVGGAILSTPLLVIHGTEWITTTNGVALSLYLGIITVGVVYTCLGWGLRKLPAPTVVTLTLAEPMTAAILSTVVLHQSIGATGWVGVGTVLAALVVTARDDQRVEQAIDHGGPEYAGHRAARSAAEPRVQSGVSREFMIGSTSTWPPSQSTSSSIGGKVARSRAAASGR